jgi:hypothetical protein
MSSSERFAASLIVMGALFLTDCRTPRPGGTDVNTNRSVSEAEARATAEADASHAYRDLSIYNVSARLAEGKWYVDYRLKDKTLVGGGPHYVISAETGEVLSKRYAQ